MEGQGAPTGYFFCFHTFYTPGKVSTYVLKDIKHHLVKKKKNNLIKILCSPSLQYKTVSRVFLEGLSLNHQENKIFLMIFLFCCFIILYQLPGIGF